MGNLTGRVRLDDDPHTEVRGNTTFLLDDWPARVINRSGAFKLPVGIVASPSLGRQQRSAQARASGGGGRDEGIER